jgi:histone H3/H4
VRPGKSHARPECGARSLTCDVVRLRHKFRAHGEERPLETTIDGFIVLKGVYIDDVLGGYVIKEEERFQRTVRVLKCEENGCTGIAGRSQDTVPALCVACAPLTVPARLLHNAKVSQAQRAARRDEAASEGFHDRMTPQALHDKWSADKACVHCGRETVMSADVELYRALSMGRLRSGRLPSAPLLRLYRRRGARLE